MSRLTLYMDILRLASRIILQREDGSAYDDKFQDAQDKLTQSHYVPLTAAEKVRWNIA